MQIACNVPLINRMNPHASFQSGTRQHGWHCALHCILPQAYISAGYKISTFNMLNWRAFCNDVSSCRHPYYIPGCWKW